MNTVLRHEGGEIDVVRFGWEHIDCIVRNVVDKARLMGIMQVFPVNRGGLTLAHAIAIHLGDLSVIHQEIHITDDTLVIEDIVHTGDTLIRLLERLRTRNVRPKVACWVCRVDSRYTPDIVVSTLSENLPVIFPWETLESALASFNLSESGRS